MSKKTVVFFGTPGKILYKKCKEKAINGNELAAKIIATKTKSASGNPTLRVEVDKAEEAAEIFQEAYKEWYNDFLKESKSLSKKEKVRGYSKYQSFERKYRKLKSIK